MLTLPQTARAARVARDEMEATFKAEIAALSPDALPLQQGMAHGNVAQGDTLSAMVIGSVIGPERLRIHAGLFFTSVVAGCACTNDPSPMNDEPEYVEVEFEIDCRDGATQVRLLDSDE
ncbi:hypothetical protein SR882_02710 [Guyparkeria halophila]|uniref:DUF177 domain-containing protein n=1 Tax=Guyparkeria halophila TaxID=47960 RepID=A0ABZ0YXG1_9GAMM|nr:hypothetical protein [Guyparkeria halophila]WQH16829.1 hypothetical protein SR882_02710 [Guyparkeria halophila]